MNNKPGDLAVDSHVIAHAHARPRARQRAHRSCTPFVHTPVQAASWTCAHNCTHAHTHTCRQALANLHGTHARKRTHMQTSSLAPTLTPTSVSPLPHVRSWMPTHVTSGNDAEAQGEREGSADLGRCSSDACYGDQTKRLASLSSLSHYQLTIRCRERHIGSRGSKHVLIDNLVGLAQQELEEAEEAYELSGYAPNEVRDQKQ